MRKKKERTKKSFFCLKIMPLRDTYAPVCSANYFVFILVNFLLNDELYIFFAQDLEWNVLFWHGEGAYRYCLKVANFFICVFLFVCFH